MSIRTRRRRRIAVFLFPCLLAGSAARGEDLSEIRFPTSCAPQVEGEFLHGLALLHSFEYPDSTRVFGALVEQHPECAMGYWGAAMSLWHPLWAPPSAGELERGAALLRRTETLEQSPREAAYLAALAGFFSSTDVTTHRQRATEYQRRMERLAREHLDDPVDLLFGVQLGGGTDINRALAYCQTLISRPEDTIFILISDLYEGGNAREMLGRAAQLVQSGVQCIALLALSDEGAPFYDHAMAARFATIGIPTFACTPDQFPDLMAQALARQDLVQWAAREDIVLQQG